MYYMAPSQEEIDRLQRERAIQDSLRALGQTEQTLPEAPEFRPTEDRPSFGLFDQTSQTDTLITVIETPLYRLHFSNLGAGPVQVELLQHRKWSGGNVHLIADTTRSAYNLGFLSTENYNVDTNRLLFTPLTSEPRLFVGEDDTQTLVYALELEDGRTLYYEYTFYGNRYQIGLNITFDGVRDLISGGYFEFGWQSRLKVTEKSRSQEAQYSSAYVFSGGALEDIQLTSTGRAQDSYTGNIGWVATKTKFFTQIIKPLDETDGGIITAEVTGEDENIRTHYTSTVRKMVPQSGVSQFELYIGPLDYYELRHFDESAYNMVDTGFRFMRWFSDPLVKWVILPFFTFFGGIIPNMGLVIILFAFVIKLVLYPLTKKSFESMAAMRELQPEMKVLQEKYKDNPQAQQQATMKLFKKAKVNPLGGCLPNLLQAPVLITLWRYFQNSIEIRQESFLWATDLSAPDPILNLPFAIPFMGDFISGFVLLMAGSMVIQMRISGAGATANPQMKMFQYIMPIVLFMFFNQFASGLSLYYFIYNTLSIGQQMLINKQIDHVKMMETVDKKKARQMARELKQEEKEKNKDLRNKKPK
jgi:YidC/Oxa1 family membrane protein insertase